MMGVSERKDEGSPRVGRAMLPLGHMGKTGLTDTLKNDEFSHRPIALKGWTSGYREYPENADPHFEGDPGIGDLYLGITEVMDN